MKIIQHIDGVVVDIINVRDDVTAENIIAVDSIPPCEHRTGYNAILKYGENGLYWDYEEAAATEQTNIRAKAEAYDILMGVSE